MSLVSTLLLVHVFTAILPPNDDRDQEQEYFHVLGLEVAASATDIKKAYRTQSLALHPDKIAQRGDGNPEEAAARYEKVQEAYAVLSDPDKRNLYHQFGHSPARYKFAQNGGLYNPMQCYQNLGQASMVDKTRLVGVVASLFLLLLMQPILVAARVNQELHNDSSLRNAAWVAILTPTWILCALVLVFWGGLTLLGPPAAKLEAAAHLLQHILVLAGLILLAQNWDRPLDAKESWHSVSVPFYLAIFASVLAAAARAAAARAQLARMVSPQKFQADHPDFEDLPEQEQTRIAQTVRIVQVDEETVAHTLEILREDGNLPDDDDLEAIRITTSPDYEMVVAASSQQIPVVLRTVFVGIPLIALIASKLQGQIAATWWVVFLPIWLLLGQRIAYGALLCCFTPLNVGGDGVVVVRDDGDSENDDDDDDDDENDGDTNNNTAEQSGLSAEPEFDLEAAQNSVQWASSEGKMDEFTDSRVFDEKAEDLKHYVPRDPSEAPSDEGGRSELPVTEATRTRLDESSTEHGGEKTPADPPGFPASKIQKLQQKRAKAQATQPNNGNENGDAGENGNSNDDDDDDDDGSADSSEIEIDAETFQAFKKAQQEAEANAMEAQAKAHYSCCMSIFQLIMICVVVGKLEQDFDLDAQGMVIDHGSVGYSAFWVLFPIFMVAATVFFCCACIIYNTNGQELDAMAAEGGGAPQHQQQQQSDDAAATAAAPPIVLTPDTLPQQEEITVPTADTDGGPVLGMPAASVAQDPSSPADSSATTKPEETASETIGAITPVSSAAADEVEDMNELD